MPILNIRAISLLITVTTVAVFAACGSNDPDDAVLRTPTPNDVPRTPIAPSPTLPPSQSGASVIFVIDQSESMGEDFGGITRLEAVAQAFAENGQGTALGDLSQRALIGASLVSGSAGEGGCPLKAGISPGADNLDQISGLLSEAEPLSGAPIGSALDDAISTLNVFPGNRLVVLITDGVPTSCDSSVSQDLIEQESIGEALAGFVRRIETRVISLGGDASEDYLRRLANSGAGIPPSEQVDPSREPELWMTSNVEELKAAIEEVVSGIQP